MAYVSTKDTDAALKQATDLGGAVRMAGMDIPKVGRFGVFSDPQGAVLSLLAPSTEAPPRDGPPGVHEVVWHELATTDAPAAFNFYHTMFGWEKTSQMEMGPGNIDQMFGQGGEAWGGMYNLDAKEHRPPSWLHYVEIEDVDRAATQIPQLGGKIVNGPMDVPGGRIVVGVDPQGAYFALHSAKRG